MRQLFAARINLWNSKLLSLLKLTPDPKKVKLWTTWNLHGPASS